MDRREPYEPTETREYFESLEDKKKLKHRKPLKRMETWGLSETTLEILVIRWNLEEPKKNIWPHLHVFLGYVGPLKTLKKCRISS